MSNNPKAQTHMNDILINVAKSIDGNYMRGLLQKRKTRNEPVNIVWE